MKERLLDRYQEKLKEYGTAVYGGLSKITGKPVFKKAWDIFFDPTLSLPEGKTPDSLRSRIKRTQWMEAGAWAVCFAGALAAEKIFSLNEGVNPPETFFVYAQGILGMLTIIGTPPAVLLQRYNRQTLRQFLRQAS